MWSHRLAATVRGLTFSSDGRTLYSADNAGRVYAWDAVARTRRLVLKHELISGQAPYGLAAVDRFVVFLDTKPLRVWDFTGAEAKRLDVPERFAQAQVDATRGRLLAFAADGGSILTWSLASQKRGSLIRWPAPARETWRNAFRLSDDGRTLAMEASRGQVTFHDMPSGGEIGRMPPQDNWATSTPVFLSPDGLALGCVRGSRWQLWNVPAGTLRSDLWWHPLAFHPTAPVCAVASAEGFALVSTQTGAVVGAYDFDLGSARHGCFSSDGLTCAVSGSNKRFAVFDVDI